MTIDHVKACPCRPIWQQRPNYPGWLAFIFAACLVCSPVHADDNPPPDATLEAKFTCSLQPVWNDKRSRAALDGFFYLPYVGPTEYIIGGYGNRNKILLPSDCVLMLRDSAYLAAPAGWELIWKDKGSGAKLDGSMWRAIPPDETYRCVGHVPQEGYDEPYIPNYRCVHVAFTEEIVTGEVIWSDKGSGADKQVTMLHLPNTRSFVAVGARVEQLEAYDLRMNYSTATEDVVVVQAGDGDSSANEVASAEPVEEGASGATISVSTSIEAEAGQSLNTDGAEAQSDALGSEAARLRAAAEAALAAEDFDLAADYLARLRTLHPNSPAGAEGGRGPPAERPAQADNDVSEPGEQTVAQTDTGVAQPGDEIPVEADTSVSKAADKPLATTDTDVLETGNEPPIITVAADSEVGDELSVATETGFSEISEAASVTTDAGLPEASEGALLTTDTSISEPGEQTFLTTDADAPEASDRAPTQTTADTGDMTVNDEPLAQADSIETTPKPSEVTGTLLPPQQPGPQVTETKIQALPSEANKRLHSLPPEIVADRYLLQLEERISEGDHATALELIQRLVALENEHSGVLPESFQYRHAEVALLAGSVEEAEDAANKYLITAGKDGEFYSETLRILARIEQVRSRLAEAPKCGERRYSCWMALANIAECYIWSDYHGPNVTVGWSGKCSGGFAQGDGTLRWDIDNNSTERQSGSFQDGKRQGRWTERDEDGNLSEGSYVDGKRHGDWTFTDADDGSDNSGRVTRTKFVDGQRHGLERISWPSGQTLELPYVDGLISGTSTRRFADGGRVVGIYSNSEKEGSWKHYDPHGSVIREETYSKGDLHGPWRHTYPSGCNVRGSYSEAKKQGIWEECSAGGVERGSYVDGERNGIWKVTIDGGYYERRGRESIRRKYQAAVTEGPYIAGKRNGVWRYKQTYIVPHMRDLSPCHEQSRETYVDGRLHGEKLRRSNNCECWVYTYSNGDQVSKKKVGKRMCRREFD